MIVRPKVNWFRMLFAWEGSVQRTILLPLAIILGLALLALWGRRVGEPFFLRLHPVPFSLIGVALAIFASFRNNACYDRYWEGRKLWGTIMTCSRWLARFAATPVIHRTAPGNASHTANLLAAFAYTLRHQLRNSDPTADLVRLLPAAQAADVMRAAYRPHCVLLLLQGQFTAWYTHGRISDVLLAASLAQIDQMGQAAGGCERIRTTPVPYAYEVLLHRTTYFYCALLPFGLVESIGWATPIVAVFIAYAFLALHIIAGELEDPFGVDANDLPLDALCTHIERAVLETTGATGLPAMPLPDVRYRLY